ncbi:MAG: hypothetical protein LBN30_03635 [Oscillospiraceae bacterium]|jgi:hypothetical protein|nr:hypothetical protein [Oscillospiraceae bacterium]
MTGSLQVKNDKYYMVLNRIIKGKRKQKWVSTGLEVRGNKRRAEQMLREMLVEMETESQNPFSATFSNSSKTIFDAPKAGEMLFAEWIRLWFADIQKRVNIVTYEGYRVVINTHILPAFDALDVKLCDVTHELLQEYIDGKGVSGRKDGKAVSPHQRSRG